MKKLTLTALFVVLAVLSANSQQLFYGGSVNFTGGANLFVGYDLLDQKYSLVGNWYGSDIVGLDLAINITDTSGYVISTGFSTTKDNTKNFVTLLKVNKIAKKYRCTFFSKLGLNISSYPNISKFYKKLSPVVGVGFKYKF